MDTATRTGYTERELYAIYDEMLDDCIGSVKIGYGEYSPSQILKNCDPIAYRCGFIDWTAEEGYIDDPEGEYDYILETED